MSEDEKQALQEARMWLQELLGGRNTNHAFALLYALNRAEVSEAGRVNLLAQLQFDA